MARKKRRKENERVYQRRVARQIVPAVLRLEPVIRVHDRRDAYKQRRDRNVEARRVAMRKEFDRIQAPRRFRRRARAEAIATIFGQDVYHKLHNCKQEWRKLLSWRSAQGSGRKRTPSELNKNYLSFIKKDC